MTTPSIWVDWILTIFFEITRSPNPTTDIFDFIRRFQILRRHSFYHDVVQPRSRSFAFTMNSIGAKISSPVFTRSSPSSLTLLRRSFKTRTSAPFLERPRRNQTKQWIVSSSEIDDEIETAETTDLDPSYISVLTREQLPKGERREVIVDGKQIVVFWYRNELFACEARSPAEGAFSTGFLTANFTEDYGIICPGTDTVFSLKTGEILDWYPSNPVLRFIIPKDTCRPLEIYPVKLTKDAVYVSFSEGNLGGVLSMRSKGGSNTASEGDNVFGIEPRVYYDNAVSSTTTETTSSSRLQDLNPATVFISTIAVAIVAIAGTAVAIYFESIPGLIIFWIVLFGIVAFTIAQILGLFDEGKPSSWTFMFKHFVIEAHSLFLNHFIPSFHCSPIFNSSHKESCLSNTGIEIGKNSPKYTLQMKIHLFWKLRRKYDQIFHAPLKRPPFP